MVRTAALTKNVTTRATGPRPAVGHGRIPVRIRPDQRKLQAGNS